MSSERLPPHVEVAALLRRVAADGGFATVLKRGDPDRGSILLFISCRGAHVACLERVLNADGHYSWRAVGPSESAGSTGVAEFLASRARFDEDMWAIELDIADAERFIAETKLTG